MKSTTDGGDKKHEQNIFISLLSLHPTVAFSSQGATQHQKLIVPHPPTFIGTPAWIDAPINETVTMATGCQVLIGYFWPSESGWEHLKILIWLVGYC